MIKINPAIYDRLSTIPVSKHETIIQYLLCLYFQLSFNHIPLSELQRRSINTLGIINYNESEGVVFTTPLFIQDVIDSSVKHSFYSSFLALFPSGTLRTLGYDVKGSGSLAESKLKKFIAGFNSELKVKYNIEQIQECILLATTKYLQQRKQEGYKFTKIAHQFVHHQLKGSELQSWCRLIIDEKITGVDPPSTGIDL